MALTKVPSNLDATIATTQSQADNSTNIATTAYVDLAISNLSDSAPAALNTLNEIAAALGDDANYASTTTAAIAGKLPLAGGTMTGNLTVNAIVDADNYTINGGQGTDGQVLTSTGTGVAWEATSVADGSVTSAKLDTNIAIAGTLGVTGAITSTSTTGLHVDSSDSYARVDLESPNNRFFLQVEDSSFDGFGIYDNNNSAWRMSVLTNGNVGIGTTDPLNKFVVAHQSHGVAIDYVGATLPYQAGLFTSSSALTQTAYGDLNIKSRSDYTTYGIGFFTANVANTPTLRMKIDSNGTVLVGKTATTLSVAGVFIGASGSVGATRASDDCLTLNRTGNDGAIASFYKDGVIVGSIGVNGGDLFFADASYGGIKPLGDAYAIVPSTNSGADYDNAMSLGTSGIRFKDLHLSGTMLGNITKLRQHTDSMYVSPTNTNTLNGNFDADNDSADMWINYRGYQDGFSRFRDFRIGNGKSGQIVFVDGSAASVAITGSLSVTSAFSKGSGSFKIDHPLEAKKDTHHLIHSFVEAPQADNIYRGKIDLVAGSATANIDTVAGMTEGTFVALNREVQCFTTNESNWDAVKGSVSGNILTIESENSESTATISWLVIGERKDQHMYDTDWTDDDGKVIVEPLKETLENA